MLVYSDNINNIGNCERTYAIIITTDGEIYSSDINHQECMLEYQSDFFAKRGIDLLNSYDEDYDIELEAAIEVTNNLFQRNEFYGFDIYENYKTGEAFFISHYPQNLDKCYDVAKLYADTNDLELGSFTSINSLGQTCRRVEGVVANKYPIFSFQCADMYYAYDIYDDTLERIRPTFVNEYSLKDISVDGEMVENIFIDYLENKSVRNIIIRPIVDEEDFISKRMFSVYSNNNVVAVENDGDIIIYLHNSGAFLNKFIWSFCNFHMFNYNMKGELHVENIIFNDIMFFGNIIHPFQIPEGYIQVSDSIVFKNCNFKYLINGCDLLKCMDRYKRVAFESCSITDIINLGTNVKSDSILIDNFIDCYNLEELDISGLNIDIFEKFEFSNNVIRCRKLEKLILPRRLRNMTTRNSKFRDTLEDLISYK